jgi:hypothetical protein
MTKIRQFTEPGAPTPGGSRRTVLSGLAGVLLAIRRMSPHSDAAASKKGKRRKNKKRKNGKAQTRVDARCTPEITRNLNAAGGDRRIAQTFTAVRSGQLVSVEISAHKAPGSSGDFVLRLTPLDSTGVPTANVLAEAVVAEADLPESPAIVRFTFPNPFPVVAGTEYALVLTRFAGGAFNWQANDADPCEGNHLFSGDQSGPFGEIFPGLDLIYTTFVRS